uniref:Odorant receptor n=1 Tax=Eucryptorrhynchus scrobiculatus TaxID=1552824 RepID=A0A8F4RSK8_EUCSC|nr:odorant receptor 13 [Eucryptorrhynchus scrobiculatus]
MAGEKRLFKLVRFMLIISGLWPLEIHNVSKYKQILYEIYYVVAHMIYLTSPFAFGGALISDYGTKEAQALEDFSRMLFVILIIFKLKIIRSTKMKNMINMVTSEEMNIIKSKDRIIRNIYQFHVNYCTKMVFCIIVFLYAAGLINMFNGFLELYKWDRAMQFTNETTTKPHIIPFWFPFDEDKHYILAVTYQIVHIYQTLAINGAVQALINSVMVFLRANLKILQHRIRNFDKFDIEDVHVTNRANYAEKNLNEIVLRHQKLIHWVKDLNESFRNILLLEYSVTSLQLATTLIQIIELVHIPFNGTFFLHCFLQLFGIAWNANEILLESSIGLSEALYESNWYNHKKKISFPIYFMMMRCQKPLEMRIGPLGTMDLNAAVSRAKLAYTCLSVLQVTTKE